MTDFRDYSNIFFSNGDRDPWKAGSPSNSINQNIIAFEIEDAAHHLDLRLPNDNDPQGVRSARNLETLWLRIWLDDDYTIVTH